MANKALKLRLQAEAREFDEQKSRCPAVSLKAEHGGNDIAAPSQVKAETTTTAVVHVPSVENLLPVPPAKATLAEFPPGCSVLYTDTLVSPPVVSKGTVGAVFVDLSPEVLSRDYFYKVSLGNERFSVIAAKTQLQWAPYCPVWVRLPHGPPETRAIIIGSYQGNSNASPMYSVQEVEPGTSILHGVTSNSLQYRLADVTNEQHVAPCFTSSLARTITGRAVNVQQEVPQTSIMSDNTVPMVVSSTPAVKKPDEHVSRVTSSPRKRPIEDALENDPSTDGCSAEFRMPSWMKALCLEGLDQVCLLVQDCTECRATILESSQLSSTPAEQSIFVYGKDTSAVEHAITAVSDLLQEYVSKDDKERLAAEISTGWIRSNTHENASAKTTGVLSEATENSETSSGIRHDTDVPLGKKAKTARSPSEEGECTSDSDKESTSKILFQSQRNSSKNEPGTETLDVEEEVGTDPAGENEYMDQPGLVTRIIKVPQLANDRLIKDALVGSDERNRNYVIEETGCDIVVRFPDVNTRSLLAQIEVVLTGAFDDGDFDFAQRWVENRIVSTVPVEEKGRMLFHLAKDNNYGASEGRARYQRSPFDLKSWVWMNVVELPEGFHAHTGLFMDTNAKAIKAIMRSSQCRHIQLCDTVPKHVFLCSGNLDQVDLATEAVKTRVLWALNESNKRNNKKRW